MADYYPEKMRLPSLHVLICFLEWLMAVSIFIYGLFNEESWEVSWRWSLWVFFCAPIFNEALLTFKWIFCACRVTKRSYVE
jgi:histone deacetylase 11